jgi:hypothetical protein
VMMNTGVPPLLLACLFVLTFFLDIVSPVDTLAKLAAPCITWPILLGIAAVWVTFGRGERGKLEEGRDRSDAKIAICFMLANVCSTAVNEDEGTIWRHVSPSSLFVLICRFCCQ